MLLHLLDIKELFCAVKRPVFISVFDNSFAQFLAGVELQSSGVHSVELPQNIVSPVLVLVVQFNIFELDAVVNLLINIADELKSEGTRVKGSSNTLPGSQPEHTALCKQLVLNSA